MIFISNLYPESVHMSLDIINMFPCIDNKHSGNYRAWIHSETCTRHDTNIQSVLLRHLKCA